MSINQSQRAVAALGVAPPQVQRAFIKQMNLLLRDLSHPGLDAKKYDETNDVWQGRINDGWRFWFKIQDDTYQVTDLAPRPK
jgi:hypothetical protein